jgi:CheY-like chemotaxis protein
VRRDDARTCRRILVVEDDLDLAEVLEELFRTAGYELAVANDGPAALARAASFLPQIVLVDIHMPTMDGYELCTRLASQPNRSFRIVALTGDVRIDEAQARMAGFDGLLLKPIDFERAVRLLEQLRLAGAPGAAAPAAQVSA